MNLDNFAIKEQINAWLKELNVNPLDANGYAPYFYQNLLVGVNVLLQQNTLFIRCPFFEVKENDPKNIALFRKLLVLNYYYKDTFHAFFSVQKSNNAGMLVVFLNARRTLTGLSKDEFLKCLGSAGKSAVNLLPQLRQEFGI